eukprot:1935318-Prymnesium_polylepis.1
MWLWILLHVLATPCPLAYVSVNSRVPMRRSQASQPVLVTGDAGDGGGGNSGSGTVGGGATGGSDGRGDGHGGGGDGHGGGEGIGGEGGGAGIGDDGGGLEGGVEKSIAEIARLRGCRSNMTAPFWTMLPAMAGCSGAVQGISLGSLGNSTQVPSPGYVLYTLVFTWAPSAAEPKSIEAPTMYSHRFMTTNVNAVALEKAAAWRHGKGGACSHE